MIRRDPHRTNVPKQTLCRLAALDSRPTSEDDHSNFHFLQTMISPPLACPHVPTPRSHPRCLDPPSDFPNYRAHLQSPPNDTQISSLESNQSLSEDLFPKQPRRECQNSDKLDILFNRQKHMVLYIFHVYKTDVSVYWSTIHSCRSTNPNISTISSNMSTTSTTL